MNRTGPAHQVREEARASFIEKIEDRIVRNERRYGELYVYRILLIALSREIGLAHGEMSKDVFPAVPPPVAEQVLEFYREEVLGPVKAFAHSEVESMDLFARLFVFASQELRRIYFAALETQQLHDPQAVLHASSPSEPMQYE